MITYIKLKNTPIREIIFTISFNENIPIEQLDKFKEIPAISKKFPLLNRGFNMHLTAFGDKQPTSQTLLDGYILKSGTSLNRIIQAKRGSFSYHKVNGYEDFNILTNEINEYWNLLIQTTGPLTVNNLSVRYVNFIELSGNEKQSDLLTLQTTNPFGELQSLFTQFKFKYDKNPEIAANVVVSKVKEGDKNGILLDIILNKKISNGEKESQKIFALLKGLRDVKNDLFFRSITEQTIKKYNQ